MSTLPLRDDMAATLQARLSWPQADACADDLTAMFGRRMRRFPLTCEYCTHAPASHLLVADLPTGRAAHLVCGPCGTRNVGDARKIAKSAPSAWLFALIPADEEES